MVQEYSYGGTGKKWLLIALCSLALLTILSLSLLPEGRTHSQKPITVYCAAGIRLPVEAAAKRYQDEFGIPVRLDYGSSGAMETRLRQDVESGLHLCDVFIPADNSFARRCQADGVTAESIPLAEFHLVYACPKELGTPVTSMNDVLQRHKRIAVCDLSAAAGKKTKKILEQSGHWEQLQQRELKSAATVVEAASWIRDSEVVEGGFIWNTTALQHGLFIYELNELAPTRATVTANVSTGSLQPPRALHFMRYLQAPEKGGLAFKEFNFAAVQGDRWADIPEVKLYAGGLNRESVKDLIAAFEQREGVKIITKFGGCGMLVSDMRALQELNGTTAMPDLFLTCDASYMEKVDDSFGQPVDVSSTRVVMLVAKGNPKKIKTLADLAREDVRAATTNPSFSTLGDLSWQLLAEYGIDQELGRQRHIVASATTAHDLILQMQNHNILDCALVYRANVVHILDKFDIIPIDHPLARAVQNVAAAKQSAHPFLTQRLLRQISSAQQHEALIKHGFDIIEADTAADE